MVNCIPRASSSMALPALPYEENQDSNPFLPIVMINNKMVNCMGNLLCSWVQYLTYTFNKDTPLCKTSHYLWCI